jgi:poly(A) polymerase
MHASKRLEKDHLGPKCQDALSKFPHFSLLQTIFLKNKTFVVGGALRDIFSGKTSTDLDLISENNPSFLAKEFASKTGGHWFWLDDKRKQSRVILDHSFGHITYDFAPLRATTLLDDLKDRDFTVNAMAVQLNDSYKLIDPLGGYRDLLKKTLRVISPNTFENDPVRILKGIRHAVTLNFTIEPHTLDLMLSSHLSITSSAPERIRHEFWKILTSNQFKKGLLLLDQIGFGTDVFGPNFKNALLEIIEITESSNLNWEKMSEINANVIRCLDAESEYGLNYKGLILLSVITSKVDKNLPRQISREWLLSRKTSQRLEAISGLDQGVFVELDHVAKNKRSFYFWAAKYQLSVSLFFLVLTALSRHADSIEFETLRDLLDVIKLDDNYKPKEYVNGEWIKQNLTLEEGIEIKKAIQILRNAEIFGQVNSVDQAKKFLFDRYLIND